MALALAAPACGDDGNGDEAPEASAEIVSPTGDEPVGESITAVVKIEGFDGRLRFTMDRGQFDFPRFSGPAGRLARKLGVDGQYSPATEPRITYRNLPPGEHVLTVALVDADYTETIASDSVAFTVE